EPDYFTTRGYGLDTIVKERCSREFQGELGAIGELIDLAARGEWKAVEEIHRLWGKERGSLTVLGTLFEVRLACRRLMAGQAHADDLLLLAKAPQAQSFMRENEATW